MLRSALIPFAFGLLAITASFGCEVTVVDGDDGHDGQDDDGECCLAMPACPAGAVEVDTCPDGSCFTEQACCTEILCHPQPQCFEGPSCDFPAFEVDTCPANHACYEVTACEITILCAQEAFCGGVPSCDPGDVEVAACPDDAVCYTAELCGTTITCVDGALPQHGCPPAEPRRGLACTEQDKICDYPTQPDCFSSYLCADGAWTFIGGGCGIDR
jgi:hypothetical protein